MVYMPWYNIYRSWYSDIEYRILGSVYMQYIMRHIFIIYTEQYTLYSIYCSVYIVHCTLHSLHYIVYNGQCSMYAEYNIYYVIVYVSYVYNTNQH